MDNKENKKSIKEEGIEEKSKEVSGEQIKKENKILKNFFIVVGFIVIAFIAAWFLFNYTQHFDYKGVRFDIDTNEIKGVTLYRTSIPVYTTTPATGKVTSANYNFWLRNDPRNLEKEIPMTRDVIFRKNIVLDLTDKNLSCNSLGDWNLGLATLTKFNLFNINVTVKDKKVKYKPSGDYMFMTIDNKANVTEIKQLNETAYKMSIKNCDELLPSAERFLVEGITKYKELNK